MVETRDFNMAESFFILWGQDLDSWFTNHFSIAADDNRYTINKQERMVEENANNAQ